ncbi:MAG: methyltransferase domain-containing protein [Victivallales bacterium]|nr:methyltransferase domain-containing protein [Victivallales bacterium]
MKDSPNTPLLTSLSRTIEALAHGDDASPQDKLLHNILMTLERNRPSLEWLLKSRCRGKVKPTTRNVLLWALVEILKMGGVPAPAVVDTAVSYIKRRHSASEANFVNAVLRGICRDCAAGETALFEKAPPAIRANLPAEFWERWLAQFGTQEAERLATILQVPAQVVLRLRQWPELAQELPTDLLPFPAPDWAPNARLFTPAPELKSLDSIMARGDFYIQDPSTLLAPTLLAAKPGETIADLCCAPGGKSRCLAEAMRGEGTLLCTDIAPNKLARVRQNLAPFPNVQLQTLDAASDPLPKDRFHAILLDVPCSNSGVIRRRPDVRSNFSLDKLQELLSLQSQILDNAATAVRPAGRLVYSTCSIETDENQRQVQAFLERHPNWSLVSQRTILPDNSHDGSFAALLSRRESFS